MEDLTRADLRDGSKADATASGNGSKRTSKFSMFTMVLPADPDARLRNLGESEARVSVGASLAMEDQEDPDAQDEVAKRLLRRARELSEMSSDQERDVSSGQDNEPRDFPRRREPR